MSAREWWRRATSAAKDRRSIYLAKVSSIRRRASVESQYSINPDLEAAVIRATSHDDRSVDYKSAARIFALARASPSFLVPLMFALSRRATRTRSWPVALKCLMLAHGLLLRADAAPPSPNRTHLGRRLPFDLSDFNDRSSSPAMSNGFSSFVRAYFHFLDLRSLFSAMEIDGIDDEEGSDLHRVHRLQILLDRLIQIRPYTDGMGFGLILEAMDCVVIEIFEVYSQICDRIASFLVEIFATTDERVRRRRGFAGMRVLRKATEQSPNLSAYFQLCRELGVLNVADIPAVETVPEEDIRDLERLLAQEKKRTAPAEEKDAAEQLPAMSAQNFTSVVVSKEWVVFDDADSIETTPAAAVQKQLVGFHGNLIDLA